MIVYSRDKTDIDTWNYGNWETIDIHIVNGNVKDYFEEWSEKDVVMLDYSEGSINIYRNELLPDDEDLVCNIINKRYNTEYGKAHCNIMIGKDLRLNINSNTN